MEAGGKEAHEAAAQPPQSALGGYVASIFQPTRDPLDPTLVAAVVELEQLVEMPVWLLVQRRDGRWGSLDDDVVTGFMSSLNALPKNQRVALLLDSPGGQAKAAYQIAMLLRRHCSGFTVIIPRWAKSAATLLSLGADAIRMAPLAELGPLDVQLYDPEREEHMSALDEVQALERLHAFLPGGR